jgi:nucleotide-binding universal stress UspA family protein
MKTFKNIVLATDFSRASTNAYHYARHIATHFGATLTVVHFFEMPLDPVMPDYVMAMPSVADLEEVSLKKLSDFVHVGRDSDSNTLVASRLKVKVKALMGLPADGLIELSSNPSTDLLILGTKGVHDWIDKAFGSVAIKVMKQAHCPVMLIPKGADYNGIHHILYTAAPDSFSGEEVSRAIDFAKYFISTIHFVHVNAVFEDPKKDTRSMFKQFLTENPPKLPYSIDTITAHTIPDGVNQYALNNDVDLIITVTHHRGFWKDLIHHSITKDLAWQIHLPILCLHTDDKEQPTA